MPDLSTRTEHEQEVAAALLLLFMAYEEEAIAWLGFPPRAPNMPDAFYARIEREVAEAIEPSLAATHAEAAQQMAESVGSVTDERRIFQDAARWARERAQQLASDLAERIRIAVGRTVEQAKSQAEADAAAAEATLIAGMQTILSEDRAETIGITETTNAISSGEINEADRLADEFGVTVVATWITENDSRVCPVCSRLQGTGQEEWGVDYPSGPPAHPGCRCFIDWQIDGIEIDPSDN